MHVFEYQLVTAGDMSGSVTSGAQQIKQMAFFAIQAVWTGSPVGTIKLQVSNDNITFSDYTGSSQSVSGAGDFMWIITTTPYPYIRVVYTRVSGTGSLNITVNGKGP